MNICIYGASSDTIDPEYITAVESLGRGIGKRGHGLVFGGGAHGLMGAAARGVAAYGGRITGVAPAFFNVDGVLYTGCTELLYTATMRERKQMMEDRADAFVMVPGGIGTFEEFFEILTLRQLGRHGKAIAIFNIRDYFSPMEDMLETAIAQGFMKSACREIYRFFTETDALLDYLEHCHAAPCDI